MKCPLCGLKFKEEDGQATCEGCTVSGTCSLVKCPNCGYEVPKEPGFIRQFKKWRNSKNESKR